MTPIERVARALLEAEQVQGRPNMEHYTLLASAAIKALREPSEAQYDALCATGKMWRELNSRTVWQTYIDAALAEGDGSK